MSLAKTYRTTIESNYTDWLNDTISNHDFSGSCEDFLDDCKNTSFISYSGTELKMIKESNAVADLSEQLSVKIFAGIIENTIRTFNDEEFLTLIKVLHEDQFATLTEITGENAKVRDVYYACEVCGYKTHVIGDYNDFCDMCCWDFEMPDDKGRYKFNLDKNGNPMTIQEGREHFHKYGLAKFGTLSENMLFDRWLHDLANARTIISVFFEYRDFKLLHYANQ